mgnify:CR=1 FL=1
MIVSKHVRKMTVVVLAALIAGNTGMANVTALAAEGTSAPTGNSKIVDVLNSDFIKSNGGKVISVKPDPDRSPFDVFGEAFGTDSPVEGTTKLVREKRATSVRHVENFKDPIMGNVWKVENHGNDCTDGCYMHNTTYDSATDTFSGGNTDRQRIEIRPNRDTTDDVVGLENDITGYNWKLKIDKDFPKPDGFCHIFQYKSVNATGEAVKDFPLHDKTNFPKFTSDEDGNPILTLSVTASNVEFRWSGIGSEGGMEVLSSIPLNDIKDKWVDMTVKILNSECGWVTMTMKDAVTGKVLMEYNDPNRILDMWRRPEIKYNGATFEGPYPAVSDMFNRPKWGVYRKAEKSNKNLKDARIYLSDITLYKSTVGASAVNLAYGKKAYNTGATDGNALQIANAKPERLTDGVQTDPVRYTNLAVPKDNPSALGGLSWMGTEGSTKGNVIIDLGKKMDFSQVKLFAKSERLKNVDVWVSDDPAAYAEKDLNKIKFTKVDDYIRMTRVQAAPITMLQIATGMM